MLKVLSDILLGIDAGDLSALVLLDLSAAFHMVDHHILLQRLEHSNGISGLVRQWFQSYLVGRRQFVRTGSSTSSLARILICMQMKPKSMGSVVRLQRVSFRTSSLSAMMM